MNDRSYLKGGERELDTSVHLQPDKCCTRLWRENIDQTLSHLACIILSNVSNKTSLKLLVSVLLNLLLNERLLLLSYLFSSYKLSKQVVHFYVYSQVRIYTCISIGFMCSWTHGGST